MFAERLLTLAEQAFEGHDGGLRAVQTQLVGFYVDGLNNIMLKRKLIRESPGTLGQAADMAMKEDGFLVKIALRTGEDRHAVRRPLPEGQLPMEVDHYRPRSPCGICGQTSHRTRDHQPASRPIHAVERADNRVCWECSSPFHLSWQCQQRNHAPRPNSPPVGRGRPPFRDYNTRDFRQAPPPGGHGRPFPRDNGNAPQPRGHYPRDNGRNDARTGYSDRPAPSPQNRRSFDTRRPPPTDMQMPPPESNNRQYRQGQNRPSQPWQNRARDNPKN